MWFSIQIICQGIPYREGDIGTKTQRRKMRQQTSRVPWIQTAAAGKMRPKQSPLLWRSSRFVDGADVRQEGKRSQRGLSGCVESWNGAGYVLRRAGEEASFGFVSSEMPVRNELEIAGRQ